MARELTPAELSELLAAYALDAVDGDEHAQVEEWLDRSPDARLELDELRETAALLAYGRGVAPPGLWARIEGALAEEPPALVLPVASARSRRRGLAVRVTAAMAAASAVAATLTAVVLSDEMAEQEDRLEQVAASVEQEAVRRAASAAMADPGARIVRLVGAASAGSAEVVTMPDGGGFLMGHEVPRLPEGRTYQLWAMSGDHDAPTLVSTAILGRTLRVLAFHAPQSVLGFVITDEAAPGSVRSVEEPVLAGTY